jgi:uncharacterized protein (TIGR02466 family)
MVTSVMGLFPTPVMRVDGLLDGPSRELFLVDALGDQRDDNSATDLLSHTAMMDPQRDAGFHLLVERLAPHLVAFGELLFAERLDWLVKEAWMNVLETGGSQFMHTHANSFVSGIVYLTTPHPSAHTMFRKPAGGGEFIFKNDVPLDHYSSDTWLFRDASAGDLLLYPSYLSHGVPPNEGERRVSLAFNAIPDRLDSLGYRIRFGT